MPTQQSDAVGIALRQEKLKGYITALREYNLPRSGFVLLHQTNTFIIFKWRSLQKKINKKCYRRKRKKKATHLMIFDKTKSDPPDILK